MSATILAPRSATARPKAPSAGISGSAPRPVLARHPAAARPAAPSLTEVFRLADTAVIVLVMSTAFLLANHRHIADLEQFFLLRISMKNALVCAAFVLLWQGIFTAANRPSMRAECGGPTELTQVFAACTLAALAACVPPLTGLSGSFGLTTVALFWICSLPAVLLERRLVRVTAMAVTRVIAPRQVIIVGSGPLAATAFHNLCACPDARYHVLGFVDTNDRIAHAEIRKRQLGELRDLERILMFRNVDLVVIALPVKSQYSIIQEIIQVCERVGVESRYPADIFHGKLAWQQYISDAGTTAVAMKVVHDDARTYVKRLFDLVAALLGLLVLSPLLVAIAVAIRLTSPGPVFFAQDRYGLNRRVFRMYKFRTMVVNAEALQDSLEHLNEAGGPLFKIKRDPRITAVGGFLRRTSLDELPQLFNVLLGDMSLVGPRPLPLRDVRHFTEGALMRRFSVRPGLTGLWQVSGRSNLPFSDWIALDLRYIDQWSLGLDFRILLLTVPTVVRGTGAS